MLLRPRQQEFVERSIAALLEQRNTLGVAPTGAGKTILFSGVAKEWCALKNHQDHKVCVLAHRDELTQQNQSKFLRVNPKIKTSIFDARKKDWSGQVTFAMVQTLGRDQNLKTMPKLDLLVIDEAHHVVANSYRKLIDAAKDANPDLAVFGVTATPNRGDRKGLRPVFSNVADQITLAELIQAGHLVPPRTYVIDVGTQQELSGVRQTSVDFDMVAVDAIMNKAPITEAVIKHWEDKAKERPTVVFCSTVNHAKTVCEAFVNAGYGTELIHGELTPEARKRALARFESGESQIVVNVSVLTEGFDYPPVSCVVLLRPSSHKSTVTQMIGRGLRIVDPNEYPGVEKTDCVVLDFGTSTMLHGSLEQDVNLDGYEGKGDAPSKTCPDCGARVPAGTRECALCGHVWEKTKGEDIVELSDFVMSEIDLLKRSSFRWCDVFEDNAAFMATGFEAWAGVFLLNGHWYGLGGRKRIATRLLGKGDRTVCLAAADDWLNTHETEEAANKSKRWLSQAATPQQLKFLAPKYRHDFGLTRYHASCLLAFQFNKKDIQQQVFRAANREAA